MGMDLVTVLAGCLSFIVFLIIQGITFRWVNPERLLKSLFGAVVIMMLFPLVLMGLLFNLGFVKASLSVWLWGSFLAVSIEGLLSFVYVLCFFGPYETSIRMRLVREIGAKGGISLKELLLRYNPEIILKIRLQRLLGSGDIIENNGRYKAIKAQNLFFIFQKIANVLKKWIGR